MLTRLHARYGKELKDDLVFRAAPPIRGGREHLRDGGKLEEGAEPSAVNNFQGRYAIRHRWTGPVACANPRRGVWGGPPADVASQPGFQSMGARPAVGLAFAARGQIQLTRAVLRDIPELGIAIGASAAPPPPGPPPPPAAGSGAGSAAAAERAAKSRSGCGCATSGASGADLAALGFVVASVVRTRRRRGRPGPS